jgi:hypothetical protein
MTSSLESERQAYDPVCISKMSFWAQSDEARDLTFAELRRRSPVSWQPPIDGGVMASENDGYWAVITNDLIREVSTNPEISCSGQGVQLEAIPEEVLEAASGFLAMDNRSARATGSSCSTRPATGTSRHSPIPGSSTSPESRTPTSRSVVAARTSAWSATSPPPSSA